MANQNNNHNQEKENQNPSKGNPNQDKENQDQDGQEENDEKEKRGFAPMGKEKKREAAKKGGEASHDGGRSNEAVDLALIFLNSKRSSNKDLNLKYNITFQTQKG